MRHNLSLRIATCTTAASAAVAAPAQTVTLEEKLVAQSENESGVS